MPKHSRSRSPPTAGGSVTKKDGEPSPPRRHRDESREKKSKKSHKHHKEHKEHKEHKKKHKKHRSSRSKERSDRHQKRGDEDISKSGSGRQRSSNNHGSDL